MFACQECGRKFRTAKAAERALNDGCPGCGGSDIDLDVSDLREKQETARVNSKPADPLKDSLHPSGF